MEYILMFVLAYGAFTTGTLLEAYRAHKKWEKEALPVIRENEKLKCLMSLHCIDYLANQQTNGE